MSGGGVFRRRTASAAVVGAAEYRFGGFGGPGGMPTLGKAKKGKLQGFGRKKRLK